MDSGFATREDIMALEQREVTVYAPVLFPKQRPEAERYALHPGGSPEVVAWRARMATAEATTVCRFAVRGLAKVTTVMLPVAITHNLLRCLSLGLGVRT